MPVVKSISINLDKERHLRFNMNAMVKFEEVSGKSLLSGLNTANLSVTDLRALLWACLIHEDKKLTLDQVGEMISLDNLQEVTQAVTQTMSSSMPDKKGEADPNPPKAQTG